MQFKYIDREIDGTISLNRYVDYLDQNRQNFPAGVREFACADWKYRINDPRCFHDSWLEFIGVRESSATGTGGNRTLAIAARFLGPFHDGLFELTYSNVSLYRMAITGGERLPNRGHGDLIVDEITQAPDGQVRHCLEFASAVIEILSSDIQYSWMPKSADA